MEDSFFDELKSWVREKLDNGDEDKEILKCLKAFGVMAIQDLKEEEKEEDGSEIKCED